MKTLPDIFNGNIQWLYNGTELPSLSKEDMEFVLANLDPNLLLRDEFTKKIKKEILDPYAVFKHKFITLKNIDERLPGISISNITLILLFEDSCKTIAISLSDIVDKTIALLTKFIPSKYIVLYRKNPLKKS